MSSNLMSNSKSINIFSTLLLATLLCLMAARAYDIAPLKILSYVFECALIVYTFYSSKEQRRTRKWNQKVFFISVILVLNYILSPNEPDYSDLLKFFGYFCCYRYGEYLAKHYDVLIVNKFLLYTLILIPVFLVAFLDHTPLKNLFFLLPNSFVYLGVAIGCFYLVVSKRSKKNFRRAILLSACYILVCTSLGVVVAAFLTFFILNMKIRHLPYLFIGSIVALFAIFYIDIPLFVRFRDVIAVWNVMTPDDWKNLQDVSTSELSQRADAVGERTDSASSIWRLVHWLDIIIKYLAQIWTIPFGMGAGFSVKLTGYAPHNDYLLILVEYGLVVFYYFIGFIRIVYNRLKNERMIVYFVLTMFLYYLTENLLQIFPPNAILFFIVGWSINKFYNHASGSCENLQSSTLTNIPKEDN